MKPKLLDKCVSREQAFALDTLIRHPGLRTEGLSFVGFVSVSEYALAGKLVRRLAASLPLRVEPVAEISELNRICREGRSDCLYVILCNAFRARELEQSVYPALSLYRDFIFERRLKHLYVGDAGFLAAAHQRLPDLFLIHQAVLPLENLQTIVGKDLSLAQVFTAEEEPGRERSERLSLAVCLGLPPFNRSERHREATLLAALLPDTSPYTAAFRYLNLSVLYLTLGEHANCAAVLAAAARLAALTASPEFSEAIALHRAFLWRDQGAWKEAVAAFRSFLDNATAAGGTSLSILAYDGLGDCLDRLGRSEEASECFGQALAGSRKKGMAMLEALTWGKIGETESRRADFPAARRAYRRALAIYTTRGCRIPFAHELLNLGDTYCATDDWGFAAAYYRGALTLFRGADLTVGVIAALIRLSWCALDQAEAGGKVSLRQVGSYLAEARHAAEAEKEPALMAEIETCSARLAQVEGDGPRAGESFRRALLLWQSLSPRYERERWVAEGRLGSSGGGHPAEAVEAFDNQMKARQYFNRTADVGGRMRIDCWLGDFYHRRGELPRASVSYREALQAARSAGSLSIEARAKEALGNLYLEVGENEEARKQLFQASRIRQLLVGS